MTIPDSDVQARKAKILIVDDHPVVRHGLALIIQDEPDLTVCGEAEGNTEALQLLKDEKPDLVIIDILLKDGNGIDLIKQIRAYEDGTRMLVSSMHDEVLFAERALRAGALGYINKQEATTDLITAIHQVLKGKVYLSARIADRILKSPKSLDEKSGIESLSDRELEVFEMVGQGLSTREIANRLHLSIKTIETHRENIKKKLSLGSNLELIRQAVHWTLQNY